jgi:hypothetical protein
MTTTTTETKKITITMSERRPICVADEEWPVIASADRLDDSALAAECIADLPAEVI